MTTHKVGTAHGWMIGTSLVSALLTVVPFCIFWRRLPEPMASHWGFSGPPNDATPRLVTMGVFLVIPLLLPFFARWVTSARSLFATSAVAVSMTLIAWCVVLFNVDQPSWRSADLPGWFLWALGAFTVVAVVAGSWLPVPAPSAVSQPSTELSPDERAAWFQVMRVRGWWIAGVVSGSVVVASVVFGNWAIALTQALVLGLCMSFAVVRVRVDRNALSIGYGPFSVPTKRISIQDITSAEAFNLVPLEHGGWGYRGTPWSKNPALVLRGGEALRLRLQGGRTFSMTVDGASDAAALINGFILQQRPS